MNVVVVIFGILLSSAAYVLSNSNCSAYNVNGCSTPFKMPFFYKRRFTSACNKHDVCYRCGFRYGVLRENCDTFFLNNMLQSCSSLRKRRAADVNGGHIRKRSWQRSLCHLFANGYYSVVRHFAASEFKIPSRDFCTDTQFVVPCLPPGFIHLQML